VLGQFPTTSEHGLIPLSWLLAAQKHVANNKVVSSDEKRIGVDVARSGADSTVFFFREGSSVKDSTHTPKKTKQRKPKAS